ncbi:MAG: FHA domain-containing protein [Anaerolineales bacterium]
METLILIMVALVVGMVVGSGVLLAAFVVVLPRLNRASASSRRPDLAEYKTAQENTTPAAQEIASVPPPPPTAEAIQALGPSTIGPGTAKPYLEGIGGMVAQRTFALDNDETIIGRSRVCDLQLEDPKISRQHAMLRLYKGHYFLQDMQSSRGTQVNDQSIETHHLQDGDQIRMGDSVFVFHLPQSGG